MLSSSFSVVCHTSTSWIINCLPAWCKTIHAHTESTFIFSDICSPFPVSLLQIFLRFGKKSTILFKYKKKKMFHHLWCVSLVWLARVKSCQTFLLCFAEPRNMKHYFSMYLSFCEADGWTLIGSMEIASKRLPTNSFKLKAYLTICRFLSKKECVILYTTNIIFHNNPLRIHLNFFVDLVSLDKPG